MIIFPKLSMFLSWNRKRYYPIILSIVEIINFLSQIIKEDCIKLLLEKFANSRETFHEKKKTSQSL